MFDSFTAYHVLILCLYSAREPLNATEESTCVNSDSDNSSEEEVQPLRRKKKQQLQTQNQLQIVTVIDAGETVVRSSKGTGRKKRKDDIEKGTEWTMKEIVGGPRTLNGQEEYKVWWEGYEKDEKEGTSWEPMKNIRGPLLGKYLGWPERDPETNAFGPHPRPPPDQPEWKQDQPLIDILNPTPRFNHRIVDDDEEAIEDR